MVVYIEWKNTKHEDAHRSERRSALINSLTEPTLLEMSGNALIRSCDVLKPASREMRCAARMEKSKLGTMRLVIQRFRMAASQLATQPL